MRNKEEIIAEIDRSGSFSSDTNSRLLIEITLDQRELIKRLQEALAPDLDTPITDGLIGNWKFEDNCDDSSGQGHDGSRIGGSFEEGKVGNCIYLDGSGYVNMGNPAGEKLDLGISNFSFSLWIAIPPIGIVVSTGLVGKRQKTSPYLGYSMGIHPDGHIWTQMGGSPGGVQLDSTRLIDNNQWHHIVWVVNRSNKSTIYIDNQKDGEVDASPVKSISLNNSANFYVGRFYNEDPTANLIGYIDEVALYNRILSETDIETIYQQGGG